jgi:signal peptidase I
MRLSRPDPLTIARWLLDAAVIGLVAVVLGAVVLGRVVPMTGNQTLIIGGSSMEPTLPLGSAVVIRPVDAVGISVGDIVSVQSGDGRAIYTHRVIRRLALDGVPYLETKGDNNADSDAATVPATAVIGRVMLVVPLMGFLLTWLSAVSGVAFVLGLGALLVLTAMLVDMIQDDRRRRTASFGRPASARPVASSPLAGEGARAAGTSASVAALVSPGRGRPERGTTTEPARSSRDRRRSRPSHPAA